MKQIFCERMQKIKDAKKKKKKKKKKLHALPYFNLEKKFQGNFSSFSITVINKATTNESNVQHLIFKICCAL